MTRLKINLAANFAGASWTVLAGLICTPLYIQLMGIEAYGLIGFHLMLQTSLQVLDFGLSPTMNREMARYSIQTGKAAEIRDFVRTLGSCSWAIGSAIGAVIWLAAPLIATRWIKGGAIPIGDVQRAVTIMGALVALQWPIGIYQGGLLGLQRQVMLNGLRIGMITLGHAGALLILWRITPSVTLFFGWQLLVGVIQAALSMTFLLRTLPPSDRAPRFDPAALRKVWQFAAGMAGITVSAVILTQLDKVILSRMLSLRFFGYYTLAGVVSGGLYVLISPVFNAIFPRLTALAATGDQHELKLLYHRGSQLMAVLVIPVALVLALFSHDIVQLWTGSAETARSTASIIRFLVIGTALNGLMNLPYALQLAHGWTRLGLFINVVLIVLIVPSIVLMTTRFGAPGAAAMWAALNALYVIIGIPLTHRRLLKGEGWRWVSVDTALPLAGALFTVLLGRELVTIDPLYPIESVAGLIAVLMASVASAMLVSPHMREWLHHQRSLWRAIRVP